MIFIEVRLKHPILREALGEVPDVEVQWVRNTPIDDDWEMLFWATEGDFDRFDAALEADSTVRVLRSLDVGTRRLYQVRITNEGAETDLYPIMVDIGGIVMSATVSREGWLCRFGFPNQEGVDRFFEVVDNHDVGFDVHQLYEMRNSDPEPVEPLTEVQHETLVTALEAGYFDVPRTTNLQALSDQLGISDSAVSQRLRRGVKTILEKEFDTATGPPNRTGPSASDR